MKVYHYVITATVNDDDTIDFANDADTAVNMFTDGLVWDDTTQEWGHVTDDGTDFRICMELERRLT